MSATKRERNEKQVFIRVFGCFFVCLFVYLSQMPMLWLRDQLHAPPHPHAFVVVAVLESTAAQHRRSGFVGNISSCCCCCFCWRRLVGPWGILLSSCLVILPHGHHLESRPKCCCYCCVTSQKRTIIIRLGVGSLEARDYRIRKKKWQNSKKGNDGGSVSVRKGKGGNNHSHIFYWLYITVK